MHLNDELGHLTIDAWLSDSFPDHIYCSFARPGASVTAILTPKQMKHVIDIFTKALQTIEVSNES